MTLKKQQTLQGDSNQNTIQSLRNMLLGGLLAFALLFVFAILINLTGMISNHDFLMFILAPQLIIGEHLTSGPRPPSTFATLILTLIGVFWIPGYGALMGLGWSKSHLKSTTLLLLAIHIFLLMAAFPIWLTK